MSTTAPRTATDTWAPETSSDSHAVIWPYGATFGAGVVASVRITNRTRGVLYVKRGPDGDTPSATNRDWTVGSYQDSTMPLGDIGVRYGWQGLPGPDAEVTTVLTTDPQPVGAAGIPQSFLPAAGVLRWQPASDGATYDVPVPAGLGSIGTAIIDNGCWRPITVSLDGTFVTYVSPFTRRAVVVAGAALQLFAGGTPLPFGVVDVSVSPDVLPIDPAADWTTWPVHAGPYSEAIEDAATVISGAVFNAGAGVWVDAFAFPSGQTTVLTELSATLEIVRNPAPAAVAYQSIEVGLSRSFQGLSATRRLLLTITGATHGTRPWVQQTERIRGPLVIRDDGGATRNYLSVRFMQANPGDAFAAQCVVNAHGWTAT